MCNECIPVLGRFTDAYGDLKVKCFRAKLIPTPAGVNSPFSPLESHPPDVPAVEAIADVEMQEWPNTSIEFIDLNEI